MTERDIFLAALDIADRDERTSFLDQACGGKPELRAGVEELLAAHEKSGRFLNDPNDPERTLESSGHTDLGFLDPPTKPGSLGRLGHYEILAVLGRGGFGIVFKAFDDTLHRVVAIKAMAPHLAATSPPRKRFLGEARAVAAIKHENVVAVFAVEEKPIPYLVMEFVAGETLQSHLDRTGPLELAEIVSIAKQIAKGLNAAHATGLIHRDIKPANILLEAGPELKVKLTDFGLARATDDAQQALSGAICGTPMYMSPEQAQGKPLDVRSDLFSLGSVMYVMASGRPPFRAETTLAVMKRLVEDTPRPIREIVPTVPEWLCDVIGKLQSKRPAERYAAAKDVVAALDGGEAAAPRVAKPKFRRAAAAAILLPLLAGAFVVSQKWWKKQEAQGEPTPVIKSNDGPMPTPTPNPVALDRRPRVQSGGEWRLEGKELVQTLPQGAFIMFGDPAWTDYAVEVEGLTTSATEGTPGFRMIFRALGPENHRMFDIGGYKGTLTDASYFKQGKWGRSPGCMLSVPHEKNRWYKIRVEVVGASVRCSVDGKLTFAFTDADLPNGMIGLAAASPARWRNLKVTAPDGRILWEGFPVMEAASPPPNADPDRRAAEFILKIRQASWINVEVNDDGNAIGINQLPSGPFRLTGLVVESAKTLDDAGLANFAGCRNLKSLRIWDSPVTEKGLVHFADCRDLSALYLGSDTVTDAALKVFARCDKLTRIEITSKNVSDEGMTAFRGRKLTHLNLTQTNLTDRTLDLFPDCPDLAGLWLAATRISDAGLKNFANSKQIRLLVLGKTRTTDAGLAVFAGCKKLGNLDLNSCPGVTDAGLANFRLCRDLEEIDLGQMPQITDVGLTHLSECKRLLNLYLQGSGVTDDGLKNFRGCKTLRLLDLSATRVSAAALGHFKDSASSLVSLTLSNTKLGDESIDVIALFSALKTVRLSGTQVTVEGRKRLKSLLPNATIE